MDEKRDEGSFEQRLNEARGRHGNAAPAIATDSEKASKSIVAMGFRVGVELASALVVGLVIGLGLDRWLHTKPIFLLVFLAVGGAAGILNVWRVLSPRTHPPEKQD